MTYAHGTPLPCYSRGTTPIDEIVIHETEIVNRYYGGRIAGVAADVVATLAAATAEETLTITFTPTEAGVVVPEVWAEYVSGHQAVYVDRITAAQAA